MLFLILYINVYCGRFRSLRKAADSLRRHEARLSSFLRRICQSSLCRPRRSLWARWVAAAFSAPPPPSPPSWTTYGAWYPRRRFSCCLGVWCGRLSAAFWWGLWRAGRCGAASRFCPPRSSGRFETDSRRRMAAFYLEEKKNN